jgi:amino acid transporter
MFFLLIYMKAGSLLSSQKKGVRMHITTQQHIASRDTRESSRRVRLASETALPEVMPPIFGTGDMIALFLLNVFWITNITPIAAGGPAGFIYWIICGAAFFIPCSLVMAQLARLFPHEGSILNWTTHALGKRWSFFVGICAWLPGLLSIVNAAAAVISWLQALNSHWLAQPQQQGIVMIVILLFCGILACQRTRMVQYLLNGAALLMGLATVLILFSALWWLTTGHHAASNFANAANWQPGPSNFALLGSATLALFGSNMPLALAGEILPRNRQRVLSRHLAWGTIFTLGGYIAFTFAVLVISGSGVAAQTVNPMVLLISIVESVCGKTVGDIMALCLGCYFLLIPVALHLCFSRLLVVASLDRQISIWFAKLTPHRVPVHALLAQIVISVGVAVVIYFLIPSISFLGKPADLSSIAYNVIGASLLLVWAVSFLFPFIDVAVLYFRAREIFVQKHILPLPLLVPLLAICVLTGISLCLATIGFTLTNSFIPTLLPNTTWWYVIGGSALGCLVIFAALSLLSNSEAAWEAMQQ